MVGVPIVVKSTAFAISSKSMQRPNLQRWIEFILRHNARLMGWQRITTKLKHNSRNRFGSEGLKTLRVDSPS